MLFPCVHFNPARITSHFEESIMIGTRAISGSEATRLRKVVISSAASSSPSSMFTSIICAPSSTCLRAIDKASSYFFSFIRRRNLRDPATFTKFISGDTSNSSSPDSHKYCGHSAGTCGFFPSASSLNLAMYASVVPQHPPMMFTSPSSMYSFTSSAISSGVWSYSPRQLGSPAFG